MKTLALIIATISLLATTISPAAAANRTSGVIESFGDAVTAASTVHGIQVGTVGLVEVTVTWDDPTVELHAFLRKPKSSKAVASDTGATSPLVLSFDAASTGRWTVAVNTLTGATPYTVRVEVPGAEAPVDGPLRLRQPYDAPASSWQPNGRVRAIAVSGSQTWLGGEFRSIVPAGASNTDDRLLVRERIAVLDRDSGAPLAIAPVLNGHVWAISISPDGATAYVGGAFTIVDGVGRNRLAAFDTATGELLPWNPGANSLVRTVLASPDGARVYVGGQFQSVGGKPYRLLAAIKTSTGKADTSFQPVVAQVPDPVCPPRCTPNVASLALQPDGTLYIGGHFGLLNGEPRNNGGAIAVSAPTVALAWAPDVFTPDPNNPNQKNIIAAIAVPPVGSQFDDRVVICGDWYRVAGAPSPNIEAVHAITGVPVPGWTASTDGGTPACVADSTTLYIGGHFTRAGGRVAKVDGEDRMHLAAFDLADGALLPWNPGADSNLGLHRLVLDGDRLLLGGDFYRTSGVRQRGFARYLLRSTPVGAAIN